MPGGGDRSSKRAVFSDEPPRLDPVLDRHPEVQKDHLGLEIAGQAARLLTGRGLADDLIAVPLEQRAEALTEEGVIVGDDDPAAYDRLQGDKIATSFVPRPGADRTTRRPPTVPSRSRIPSRPRPPPRRAWAGSKPAPSSETEQRSVSARRRMSMITGRAWAWRAAVGGAPRRDRER